MDGEAILRAAFVLKSALGEPAVCTISGNCMAPFIVEGDELLIEYDPDRLRVGQVLVFAESHRLFVHRIVSFSRGADGVVRYVLAADHTGTFRPPMSRERIVGRVVRVRNRCRRFDLDSPSWRGINRALAWRLRVLHGAATARGWRGRLLAAAITLRRRLLPQRWSLSTAPFELVVAILGVCSRIVPRRKES